ncbi:hypothetical protein BCR33DRAFT_784686 [Rhizoclosmatium globosum]|uniref:Uncharacterized protein n=1 Tax=Rhizoclosmatium globosum TaxID=329046 RepID=A0A1Y2CEI3_9FUNG|nr:hypothetical protein BCR33DRAFT_784686 [Rhizoclosmatium globosum]|eukprot:ORY45297.1 hypothetical protein BCR33DRAFT_784686 [Rhizoclosmatium globosum]
MDNDIPMRLWNPSVKKDGTPSLSADGVRAKWPGGSGRIGDCVYVGGSMEFIGSLAIDVKINSSDMDNLSPYQQRNSRKFKLSAMISLSMCQNATKSIRNATTEDEVFKCIKSDLRSVTGAAPLQASTECKSAQAAASLTTAPRMPKADWIGFHKSECAELKTRSKMEVGMNISRYFYLRQVGERRATMPIPVSGRRGFIRW